MSQLLSAAYKLSPTQTETCVKNFAKIRHFKNIDLIFDGKPEFNKSTKEKLTKMGLEPFPITKFANNYKIYKLSNVEKTSKSVELIKKYNPTANIKNLDERIEIVIVVDTDKVDKQNYLALQALYPEIHDYLKQNKEYKMIGGHEPEIDKKNENEEDSFAEGSLKNEENKNEEEDEDEDTKASYIQYYKYISGPCFVTIFATHHIEPVMLKHFHSRFIPCNYRVLSLYDDVYPLLGSKSKLWCGLSSNFEVMSYEKLYNGYDYSIIYEDEHLVKLLNANPGDLIIGTQIINEGRPYLEFMVKEVKQRGAETNDDEDI